MNEVELTTDDPEHLLYNRVLWWLTAVDDADHVLQGKRYAACIDTIDEMLPVHVDIASELEMLHAALTWNDANRVREIMQSLSIRGRYDTIPILRSSFLNRDQWDGDITMTTQEACKYLGHINRSTLYRRARANKINPLRRGHWRTSDIEKLRAGE